MFRELIDSIARTLIVFVICCYLLFEIEKFLDEHVEQSLALYISVFWVVVIVAIEPWICAICFQIYPYQIDQNRVILGVNGDIVKYAESCNKAP